ncbi:unnamed protein product [Effrenium voratum]|uniref:Uncharacterized protein n=1 Tax=Effrenium voratum TaxID=2562239 RepID=A0AA36IIZ5_9DINO|nr:unnamed protein product [Effrenium voratum]CAJ1435918.1 unnamed protein product [Effrenium voratum]
MHLISPLEEHCRNFLQTLQDYALILQWMTDAAKLSYPLEPAVHRKYWTKILLKSSEVIRSQAFLETHGSIVAQMLELDELEVDEDTLWTQCVAWSTNAVHHPELLGPYADAGNSVKRRRADEAGTHDGQCEAILQLMSESIRFGALSRALFFDKVRPLLTHEQNYEVWEYFTLKQRSEQIWARKRPGLTLGEKVVFESAEGGIAARWIPSRWVLKVNLGRASAFRGLELSFAPHGYFGALCQGMLGLNNFSPNALLGC